MQHLPSVNVNTPAKSGTDIFDHYERWKAMVENVDRMIRSTLSFSRVKPHNAKVLECLRRRHELFDHIRAIFDVEVKNQLMEHGAEEGGGNSVLVWAQQEFLKRLNGGVRELMKFDKKGGTNPRSGRCVTTDHGNHHLGTSGAAARAAMQSRLAYRQQQLLLKRDELRKQRLLYTQPKPVKPSAADRARLWRRIPVIRERAQKILETKRSFGMIRKLVGHVGADHERVADLTRSMMRNGILFYYILYDSHVELYMFNLDARLVHDYHTLVNPEMYLARLSSIVQQNVQQERQSCPTHKMII